MESQRIMGIPPSESYRTKLFTSLGLDVAVNPKSAFFMLQKTSQKVQ